MSEKRSGGWFAGRLSRRRDAEQDVAPADTTTEPAPTGDLPPVRSPLTGHVIPLADVADPVFAAGVLGPGVAVVPTVGEARAPFDGVVTALFPTGHAVGLTSRDGVEVLIHIGLDTVQLDGEHFTAQVTSGQEVAAGDLLVSFDGAAIRAAGYDTTTPVVVTNAAALGVVPSASASDVEVRDELLRLRPA